MRWVAAMRIEQNPVDIKSMDWIKNDNHWSSHIPPYKKI